ncbi:MAG: helix-turn-helix domain-containing protein [Prevotella sp.]|nr:helix-turn-helix domain-containing protein [Prevotella sp.]
MKQRLILLLVVCVLMTMPVRASMGHFFSSDRFSSSLIVDLCQDSQGALWIATDYGLNRFDGYKFQSFLHDDSDSLSLQNSVAVCLMNDKDGRLWVGTNRGLDRFDAASESFIHYPFPSGLVPRINCLLQLRNGSIMIGTGGYGVYEIGADDVVRANGSTGAGSYVEHFFEDSRGRLWMSGYDGSIVMRENGEEHVFHSEVGVVQSFLERDDEIMIVCQHGILGFRNGRMEKTHADMSIVAGRDVIFTRAISHANGDIYIGSRGWGLFRIVDGQPARLEYVNIDANGLDAGTAKVTAMLFDRNGNLWLGCHRKGILMVPQKPVQFSCWNFELQGIRLGSTISSVCEGSDGIVWCTVQGVGVYGFDHQGHVVAHPQAPPAVEFIFHDRQQRYWLGTDDGLFSYDPLTGRSQLKVSFDCDKFNDMTSDDRGNIFISTFSRGFCVYNPQTEVLTNHHIDEVDSVRGHLCNNWVMGMSIDRNGQLWMATSSGVSCYDPATDSFLSHGWESLLPDVMCYNVCELRDGNIAIGSDQGLFLYDRTTNKTMRFPDSDQLTNKVVCYIVQSNDGDIWCSTSQGIWQYSMTDKTFIGHVNGNGLTQKEYIYGVGMHTDDDMICFGQNDGLTVFKPSDIRKSEQNAEPLHMTGFRVGDQYVNSRTVINDVRVTDRAIDETEHFTLSYLDHTITMAFSQLNFDNPMDLSFEYRVNDGDWIRNPEGQNEFTLGHLQPGSYRIEVRGEQAGEYTPVKEVKVTIRAPWYATKLAYVLYFLVGAGLLAFVLFTFRRRANQQMNEEKMKFLINATHDIRSPLTIILSALKKLEKNAAVETIESNSKRILALVNQILDVRKIDKQQMHLHCQSTDMVHFVNGICRMFEFNAQERHINFLFQHEGLEKLEAWVDRTQFDKVITNLLSNAFKYTDDGGEVLVGLYKDEEQVRMTVADNGAGLDPDSLKHIFDRFYQGANSRKLNIDGTGIGLNLCKMIVDMHHGTIVAQNRRDGQRGSLFIVTLPLGNAHLKPTEIEEVAPQQAASTSGTTELTGSGKHKVLLVDDDQEIAQYISTELSRYFKFGICSNGREGLKELLANDYDLVVSDVMMPEMDGFTMLRMIKTNMNLSHLPVIMLTSKAEVANRLEGLERGADAFLAKPFDMEELHITINSLIQNRMHLKGKFSGAQTQTDKLEKINMKGNDELLMERIMKVVNKNISDSDFNVEMLCSEVGISRTQLHRKMKEMTGLSASEFIRNIRLEQAARLLKEQKVNVTQVAYAVGFSNLAHFSTIFRKQFGVTPSEYV